MAKRKKKGWKAHKTYRKGDLSRKRGHIPVELLKSRLAKMPRHMHSLAALIRKRQAAGE